MSYVYCYEQGNCRGDTFTNRYIINKIELIEAIEYSLTVLPFMDDDAKDDYLDTISDKFGGVLLLLVEGSPFIENDRQQVHDRLQLIKDNKTFQIECEESVYGFGSTKRDAKANTYFVDGGDGW